MLGTQDTYLATSPLIQIILGPEVTRHRRTCLCPLTAQPHLLPRRVFDLLRGSMMAAPVFARGCDTSANLLLPGVLLRCRSGNSMVKHCHQVPSGCYCSPTAQQSHNKHTSTHTHSTKTHTQRARQTHHFLFSQQLSSSFTRQVQAVCYSL